MKLTKFNTELLPTRPFQIAPGPCVRFSKRNAITFNQDAVDLMELQIGDKITLAQDDDKPENWYFFKDPSGFLLKENKKAKGLVFYHKTLIKTFKDAFQLDLDASYGFAIDKKPTYHEGATELWRCIVASEAE